MKIHPHKINRRRQEGSATIIFTILLSIMLILATAESRALIQLRHEQSLLEQRQVQRLHPSVNPNNTRTTDAPVTLANQK
jgi:hypothetical protein